MDTLGPVPVRLADGVTGPTGANIVAGRLYPIWYDSACFRPLIPPINVGFAVPSRPTCDDSRRGRLWQTFGGTGSERRTCRLREGRRGRIRMEDSVLAVQGEGQST
jgi:hypothetical protein